VQPRPASTARRRRPRGRRAARWGWVVGLAALALAGCTDEDDAPSEPAAEAPGETAFVDPFAGIPDLIDEVLPATVSIEAVGTQMGQPVQGAASGVIWSADGLIVTNAHVVGPADELQVVLADGQRHAAEVVAVDERTDLAVISIDATGLPAARFADDLPRIGQLAVALGNPLGFEDTATVGIVSGLDRSLPLVEGGPVLVGLLQTDAAISSGNSGGALVDADGAVIGINVAAVGGEAAPGGVAQNLGFAIPSTTVTSVTEELLEHGEVTHAYLGIQGVGITPHLAEQFEQELDRGVLVARTEPDSPAADAGIEQGDVIVELDGERVDSLVDLLARLRDAAPGDEVTVTYVRDGAEEQVDVTLGELPEAAA
jgi:S1-C subfamily serine protease